MMDRDDHPYKVPGSSIHDTFVRNSRRLAEVWMDNYTEFFLQAKPNGKVRSGSLAWQKPG
jgi:polypeptide N-acetylgalactosaminyltransferase